MKRVFLLVLCFSGAVFSASAQNNSTTNNTIIIQGNVYYFKPATTPSSPQPKVKASDFIGTGSWYGEDAAKAWASVADWAIEHCLDADAPVKPRNGEIVYISSVHAYRASTKEAQKHDNFVYFGATTGATGGIAIYYWVVAKGAQMEDGKREKRTFRF
ncbi:MAG: hypothetical protein MdMp014T_0005 [Treponematales bacterium]